MFNIPGLDGDFAGYPKKRTMVLTNKRIRAGIRAFWPKLVSFEVTNSSKRAEIRAEIRVYRPNCHPPKVLQQTYALLLTSYLYCPEL